MKKHTTTTLKVYYTVHREMEIEVDTAKVDLDNEAEVMAFVNDNIPDTAEGDSVELCGVWEGEDCLYEW